MPATNPAGKATELEAQRILEHEGYQVIKTAAPAPFDLLAWKNSSEILCVVVRRSKAVTINGLAEAARACIDLVREGAAPGRAEYWVKYPSLWKKYQVLPGGIIPLQWGERV